MTAEPPYLVALGESQTAVVRALFDELPRAGWESCTLDFRTVGPVGESWVELTDSDGAVVVITSTAPMIRALWALRDLMAGQGRGAWLSVTITARTDGKCAFDYNYDARPNWTVEPTNQAYIEDLQKHPRPPESIPDWYRALLP